jgi:hypothetical protein
MDKNRESDRNPENKKFKKCPAYTLYLNNTCGMERGGMMFM